MCDAESGARVSPGVGLVGGSVVGENALDGDSVVSEPGNGAFEYSDGGDSPLIGADLEVGDEGLVVDDGVEEGGAPLWAAPLRAGCAGALSLSLTGSDCPTVCRGIAIRRRRGCCQTS